MQRYILHLDLDSFFVSVERLLDSSLIGKPVIVGGDGRRGVVTSCSYEARKFGVRSGMPAMNAKKLCPQATFVHSHHRFYSQYSAQVTDIVKACAPQFEKASIDEFYIDLTGMDKYFNPLKWSSELRGEIISKTKLPISFGLSVNKLVAKMATDEAKPNGELYVPRESVQSFLDPLEVGKIPFVGETMVKLLNAIGINTIYELRQVSKEILEKRFGRTGTYLWERARGISNSEVATLHVPKGISMERTYDENIKGKERLRAIVFSMAELLSADLRYEGKLCSTVALKMRFPDFETITRQTSIPATASQQKLVDAVCQLFDKVYKPSYELRLIGVRFGNLVEGGEQTDFFYDTEREMKLHRAVDELREKYGKRKLHAACSVKV